ncbi:U1-C C2H2-type zinc finger domain-containing protein [Madurella fahalii]|uniref:U1-C C2H2-type zinc finger domain-containing protein n=1 Tax=Madurella fahalii TaxID=1157608 RepID=A0ABQ0GCK5_9PEZI
MSEYWKSTPKYWCKHCSVYVRDTKLERTNHEATAKHQGAIKRSLRDLHRNAEQKEREKERAKREVERLNGVVSGTSGSASAGARPGTKPSGGAYGASSQQVTQAERQKQLEQLAELGVNIPSELRGNMAMAGEWTVTSTRVVRDDEQKTGDTEPAAADDARATGVKRERERTEEEKEQEDAIKGLFKKPRRWGIDSKTMPAEEDTELDALLSGPLVKTKKDESEAPRITTEESREEPTQDGDVSKPTQPEPSPPIKKEVDEEEAVADVGEKKEAVPNLSGSTEATSGAAGAAVMFKKRKPKNLRQK